MKSIFLLPLLGLLVSISGVRAQTVSYWVTSGNKQYTLTKHTPDVAFTSQGASKGYEIRINPANESQIFIGAGASLPDSSAKIISTLSNETQQNLANDLFGQDDKGNAFGFLRLPMGSTDLTSGDEYTYDDVADNETDLDLKQFSTKKDEAYIIPFIQRIIKANKDVKINALPWSPPKWMKTKNSKNQLSLYGGSLNTKYYQVFADYFVRFIQDYKRRNIAIDSVSIQNEPNVKFEYATCNYTPQQQADFIGQNLGPTLQKANLKQKIYAHELNWNIEEVPLAILSDAKARQYISGVAWHGYDRTNDRRNIEAQTRVHTKYPSKEVYFTEATGTTDFPFEIGLMNQTKHFVIGPARNWASVIATWALALDENSGPRSDKIRQGCDNCRGVVTINSQTKNITKNAEYYTLGHLSKFVRPGASRIESTSNENYEKGIKNVAWKNPDKSYVLLVLNDSFDKGDFTIIFNNKKLVSQLPARSVATYVWK